MLIRLMTIEDYHAVYNLWMSCTGIGLNNIDDSEDGIRRFLYRNPETCFVAEEESKVIGVIIECRTPVILSRFVDHARKLYDRLETSADHVFLLIGSLNGSSAESWMRCTRLRHRKH